MSEHLLAKVNPDISLENHLVDVANTTEKILCENGFGEDLRKAGWTAGLYHDLGKANQRWQDNVRDNSHPNHSALSALLTSSILNDESEFVFDLPREMKFGLILAILHHHSPWTNSNMKKINLKKTDFESSVTNIRSHLNSVPVPFDNVEYLDFSVQFNFNTIDYELLSEAAEMLREKVADKYDKVMEFGFHIYSALRQADWHESSKVNGGDISPIPSSFSPSDISASFDTLRPFQSEIKKVADSTSVVGLAGCGEGKTYSAMIWGKKQREQGNINRMVFAMPTQTTTNNLYNKVKDFSSESQCSIYHSSVEVFKQTTDEDIEDSGDINSNKAELYQAGFNITTIDHVLDTFVSNFDTSPIAYDNLLHSGIVFDEIHAYDEEMIGNITECIQLCKSLGIPYYIMSATIPDQIQNQIDAEKRVVSTGNLEKETDERSPFEITVKETCLDSATAVRDIDQSADKVMIVKNTVRKAQNLAKKLRKDPRFDVYYYSSEFTQVDRKEKETEITTKFKPGVVSSDKTQVLVCTQICEISLDLSSDQLLTDIAPIDAILQRAGRIHREGIEPESNLCNCKDCQSKNTSFSYGVTVYDTTDKDEPIYPYSQDTDTKSFKLLEDSARVLKNFGVYTFSKSLKATTKAYQNYQFNFEENSFTTEYCTVYNYFTSRSNRINFRNIVNRKITIFPSEYINSSNTTKTPKSLFRSFRTTDSISKRDILNFIERYSIEVPVYWIQSDDYILSREGSLVERIPSPIYDIKYSYENGINPPRIRNKTSSDRSHKTI